MANVLVVAEAAEGKLKKTHPLGRHVRAAGGGGARRDVLDPRDRRRASAPPPPRPRALGAAKVLVAEDALARATTWPSATRHGRRGRARAAAVVVGTASAYGKDLLPRVAARLWAGYASDISEVIGAMAAERQAHVQAPDVRRQRVRRLHGRARRPGRERPAERVRRGRAPRGRRRRSRRSRSSPAERGGRARRVRLLRPGEERAPRARPRPRSSSPAAAP